MPPTNAALHDEFERLRSATRARLRSRSDLSETIESLEAEINDLALSLDDLNSSWSAADILSHRADRDGERVTN